MYLFEQKQEKIKYTPVNPKIKVGFKGQNYKSRFPFVMYKLAIKDLFQGMSVFHRAKISIGCFCTQAKSTSFAEYKR